MAVKPEKNMKHVLKLVSIMLILAGTLVFTGCDDDSDSGDGAAAVHSPPVWLQGSWTTSGEPIELQLRFTSNNVFDADGNVEFPNATDKSSSNSAYSFTNTDGYRHNFYYVNSADAMFACYSV